MKRLLIVALAALALAGCGGAMGLKHGWGGTCSNRTLLGECSKPCVKHHEKPTDCGCSKSCSCWESHADAQPVPGIVTEQPK